MPRINPSKIIFLVLILGVIVTSAAPVRSEFFCRRHDCSNDTLDSAEESILGDELIRWTPLSEWTVSECGADSLVACVKEANRRCYEIGLYPEETVVERVCDLEVVDTRNTRFKYIPPRPRFSPYATDESAHPRIGVTYKYMVRSCEGALCSEWGPRAIDGSQDYIEVVGSDYACFGTENGARCEKECYPGAPKMFSAIPDCAGPF